MEKFTRSIAFRLLLSTALVSTTIVSEGSLVHYLFTTDRFDDRTVPSQMDEGVFVRTAVSTASSLRSHLSIPAPFGRGAGSGSRAETHAYTNRQN